MNNDEFAPDEQQIIQQLQSVPAPKMDPAARDTIRQRMLGEFRTINWSNPPSNPAAAAGATLSLKVILIAAAIIAALIVIALVIIQMNQTVPEMTPEPATITAPTATEPVPTATEPTITVISTTVPTTVAPSATHTRTATGVTATSAATLTFAAQPTTPPAPSTIPSIPTAPTLLPTATTETLVIIEGPITNIVANIITIYGVAIQVEPQHPILQVIQVGDIIRVEGAPDDNDGITASIVSNIPGSPAPNNASVSLEGPVESINGSIIVVNGIPVQLALDDPRLEALTVGSFVSVRGNFQGSGSNIVLVVVNVTVVNNVTVEGNSQCWYHDDAMGMGHWHCDGMGMGDPAMGMGDAPGGMAGPGMGMGDAMGMGG
jgi:hypothetical protein